MEDNTFNIQTEQQMLNHIKNIKYLVIYPDKTRHFYKSLRKIGSEICVDASTISKKCKERTAVLVSHAALDLYFG